MCKILHMVLTLKILRRQDKQLKLVIVKCQAGPLVKCTLNCVETNIVESSDPCGKTENSDGCVKEPV